MIHSMTGFGRGDFEIEGTCFQVEMRSVNHRHLDLHVRLPRLLSSFEPEIRGRIRTLFGRGKLDLSASLPSGSGPPPDLEIDEEAAARYVAAARSLAQSQDLEGRLDVSHLLALPGVARLVESAPSGESVKDRLLAAVDAAAAELLQMRRREGAALDRELRERLAGIARGLSQLAARAGEVGEAVRERLRKRTAQLEAESGPVDPVRLHQEIVLAADRVDVTEEIVRLRSHIEQFETALDGAGAGATVGRRLEFLLQEMVREANTIGSKASDAPLAHLVVDLKTELERIREQVLNVE